MPKYVIERNIPGAGKLTAQELRAISQKSCDVVNKLGRVVALKFLPEVGQRFALPREGEALPY